jgi:hypothetical protein
MSRFFLLNVAPQGYKIWFVNSKHVLCVFCFLTLCRQVKYQIESIWNLRPNPSKDNPAVFLGQLLLSKMSTAEVNSIFQTHADYMANIRTISMAPTIQNVDLIRTETSGLKTLDRNTRNWATSLTNSQGNHLQCDADNGGDTKRAQLLVPAGHMETVELQFRDYKERISSFTQREAYFTNMIHEASPLEAIYVPTAAVHSNLTFIQKRSSFTVWEQAPATVRSPKGTTPSGYIPPTHPRTTPSQEKRPLFPNAAYPPQPTESPARSPTKSTPPIPTLPHPTPDMTTQEFDLIGDDTTATHSQMTKSTTTTQNKFAEIESVIRQQQQSIRQHQEELTNINARTLTTLSLVQTTADDVLQLTEDTTRQFTELRDEIRREAAAQAAAQQTGFNNMTALFQRMMHTTTHTPHFEPPLTQPAMQTPPLSNSDDDDEDSEALIDHISTETVETDNQSSIYARSPAKKKNKRKTRDPTLNPIRKSLEPPAQLDQEPRAHYNSDSTLGEGAT